MNTKQILDHTYYLSTVFKMKLKKKHFSTFKITGPQFLQTHTERSSVSYIDAKSDSKDTLLPIGYIICSLT